ncbi:MAG: hypothetical protein K2O54_01400, partial [Prevotella sp.]|nr:hypothetical protein [Prevotella sp.]
MLIIKSGKLIGSNISFNLPADYYLESCSEYELRLISVDGVTEISIKIENSEFTYVEVFDYFIEQTNAVQIGSYFKIKRGEGTAAA